MHALLNKNKFKVNQKTSWLLTRERNMFHLFNKNFYQIKKDGGGTKIKTKNSTVVQINTIIIQKREIPVIYKHSI